MTWIPLISTIVPKNNGSFATHDSQYGKGGLMSVTSTTIRDAIPNTRRTAGMVCIISTTQDIYILNEDMVTWDLFNPSSAATIKITEVDLTGQLTVTLSSDQYLSTILVFTGTLSSNVTVIAPSVPNALIVCNYTTGAYTVSLQTLTGQAVSVAQGLQREVFSNGLDHKYSTTDFNNVALGNNVTAITMSLADNSTAVATTAFVKGQGYVTASTAPVTSVFGRTGDVVLTEPDVDPFLTTFNIDGGSY